MATANGTQPIGGYVIKNENGATEVQGPGFVTNSNVGHFRFERGEMLDISEHIRKADGSLLDKKTYTIPMTLRYPDNTTTKHVMIPEAIIQYRPANNKYSNKYGVDYITVGIHKHIYDKLVGDIVGVGHVPFTHDKTLTVNEYAWIAVNLRKNGKKKVDEMFPILTEESEIFVSLENHFKLQKNLIGFLWCDLKLKCQAPHPLNKISDHDWKLGIVINDFYVKGQTDIMGPEPSTEAPAVDTNDESMLVDNDYLAQLRSLNIIPAA